MQKRVDPEFLSQFPEVITSRFHERKGQYVYDIAAAMSADEEEAKSLLAVINKCRLNFTLSQNNEKYRRVGYRLPDFSELAVVSEVALSQTHETESLEYTVCSHPRRPLIGVEVSFPIREGQAYWLNEDGPPSQAEVDVPLDRITIAKVYCVYNDTETAVHTAEAVQGFKAATDQIALAKLQAAA